MRDIPAHVAIVTGAARGIGFAIAARLARAGAATVLADLDADGAAAASAELNRSGGRTIATPVDVADERSVGAMFAAGEQAFGACSLLVNNAGYVHQAPFEALTAADFDRMIAVHLRGTFLCARRAIGAWVQVRVGNRTMSRQVMPTRSYLSQSELPVTFGLGASEHADEITVLWPDGTKQKVDAARLDAVTIVEQAP